MYTKFLIGFALTLALLLACGDDITNIYYENINGAVFGNVVPADSGIAELTGLTNHTAPIDANGFFNFANVAPGTYTLNLRPDNHGRRQFKNVVVGTGVTTQFRDTKISTLPYPIYASYPAVNATGVYTSANIWLYSDEVLNSIDLNQRTTIIPALSGLWSSYLDYYESEADQYIYIFASLTELAPSTEYQLTIAKDSPSGVDFDDDLVLNFTTRDSELRLQFRNQGVHSHVARRGFAVQATILPCTSSDSIARAVCFEPEIPGTWFPQVDPSRCTEPGFAIRHDLAAANLPLPPLTTYKAIIDYRPLGGVKGDTVEFTTVGYEILDVRPRLSYYGVPVNNQVLVIFNEPMDTLSVRQAFSVMRNGGDEVPGTFAWNDELTELMWSHWDHPYTTGTYIIKVTTDARIITGENLHYGWESYFQVL